MNDYYNRAQSTYAIPPSSGSLQKPFISDDQQKWEDLRKQAKQIEFDLDSKLASYGRMNLNNMTTSNSLSLIEKQQLTNSLSNEIDLKLSELYQLIEQMTRILKDPDTSRSQQPNAFTYKHHIQRHRDLYHDYMKEYQRTKTYLSQSIPNISKITQSDITTDMNNRSSVSDVLLEEKAKLESSYRHADQVIEMAFAARESLHTQRFSLLDSSKKSGWIFNGLNRSRELISRISLRKKRDKYIMATVVLFCLILMFMYLVSHH